MKVTESVPSEERLGLIHAVADDAATLLNVDPAADSPLDVMSKVNDAIVDLVFGRPTPAAQDENPHLLLGALWGAQMVRQFGWYWADVVIDDQFQEVAVIAPQQEMIMFPFAFTDACINKQCICTVLLAFNMLLAKDRMGETPVGSYTNVMLHVHHIIPPYTLEDEE